MIEQEIKLCWLGAPPDLAELFGSPTETRALSNVYFDTSDRSLSGRGYGLRLRRNGEHIEQTLKGPAPDQSGVVVRQEWNWDRDHWSVDPSLLPISVGELQEVSGNQVTRTVWKVDGCEVVMDQGQVKVADQTAPIAEIEIEADSANWAEVLKLAMQIAHRWPCFIGSISKAERGALLEGRRSPADRSPLDGLGRALDPIKGPDWVQAEHWAAQLGPAVQTRIQARDANVAALCLAGL